MTPSEIVNQIKVLGHDLTMPNENVYAFVNLAIKDIESKGDYAWQIAQESVMIPSGSKTITLSHTPVKRIISTVPELGIVNFGGALQLLDAVNNDTTITIVYSYEHPDFDGSATNKIIPNDWLYILGGLYYMLVFNMSPEAALYQQKFYQEINREYAKNCFVADTDIINAEIGGV